MESAAGWVGWDAPRVSLGSKDHHRLTSDHLIKELNSGRVGGEGAERGGAVFGGLYIVKIARSLTRSHARNNFTSGHVHLEMCEG